MEKQKEKITRFLISNFYSSSFHWHQFLNGQNIRIPELIVAIALSSFCVLPCLLGELVKLSSRALLRLNVQITLPDVVIEKRKKVYLTSKQIYKIYYQYTLF